MVSMLSTLLNAGFSQAEARKLQALKQRYARGELTEELTAAERRRLEFIRWLVQEDRLSG